jgi:serine/threonine protein kinase
MLCSVMRAEQTIAVGDVIGGRYRVEAWIGQGSMASVARAKHLGTGKACALKFIHTHLAGRPEFVDLFLKEAQVGARIGSSPYIVEVFDSAIDGEREIPYLAMDFLKGESLDQYIDTHGAMPPELVGILFEQLAEALEQAHGAGVVHRDLKPSNLFLTRNRQGLPVLKVMDFGIAKVLEQQAQHTATQAGSPAYAAPEQLGPTLRKVAAKQGITIALGVSPATDVWALGLVAYELLTGASAGHYWGCGSEVVLAELVMRVALEEQPPASQQAGDRAHLLPSGFDAWFARCLRKNAVERWSTAAEAVTQLVRLLEFGFVDAATAVHQSSSHLKAVSVLDPLPPRTPSAPDLSMQKTQPLPVGGRLPAPSVLAQMETQRLPVHGPPPAPPVAVPIQPQPHRVEAPIPAPSATVLIQAQALPAGAPPAIRSLSPEASQVGVAGTNAEPPMRKRGLAMGLAGTALVALIGLALAVFILSPSKNQPARAPGLILTAAVGSNPEAGGIAVAGAQREVKVFVDGVERGILPLRLVDVAPGARAVRFDAGDRYERIERTVEIKAGTVEDLGTIQLKVLRGQIALDLATPGATVTLVQTAPNGIETTLPIFDWREQPVKRDVEGEGWKLIAKKTGYKDFILAVSFGDGIAEKSISISLIKVGAPGTDPLANPNAIPPVMIGNGMLNINSIPISKVLLDGRPLGSTPKVAVVVPAGEHNVTFVHPQMGRKSISVTVKSGETKSATVKFRDGDPF